MDRRIFFPLSKPEAPGGSRFQPLPCVSCGGFVFGFVVLEVMLNRPGRIGPERLRILADFAF